MLTDTSSFFSFQFLSDVRTSCNYSALTEEPCRYADEADDAGGRSFREPLLGTLSTLKKEPQRVQRSTLGTFAETNVRILPLSIVAISHES